MRATAAPRRGRCGRVFFRRGGRPSGRARPGALPVARGGALGRRCRRPLRAAGLDQRSPGGALGSALAHGARRNGVSRFVQGHRPRSARCERPAVPRVRAAPFRRRGAHRDLSPRLACPRLRCGRLGDRRRDSRADAGGRAAAALPEAPHRKPRGRVAAGAPAPRAGRAGGDADGGEPRAADAGHDHQRLQPPAALGGGRAPHRGATPVSRGEHEGLPAAPVRDRCAR